MREAKIVKYFLIVILVVFLYLAFITVKPLINSIVLAFVLTVVLYPVYEWLNKNIWSVNISSFLMVLFVLLIIIFPKLGEMWRRAWLQVIWFSQQTD